MCHREEIRTQQRMDKHSKITCDIVVAGAGIAGLLATVAFGRLGLRVVCADPNIPMTTPDTNVADIRTTAILQPSIEFLKSINVWQSLVSHATPLQRLRIIEAGQKSSQLVRDFDASEISDAAFGWNVSNPVLLHELLVRVQKLDNVDFLSETEVVDVFSQHSGAKVILSDGRHVGTKLVIGCDGRDSKIREIARIPTITRRYGQKVLAFSVTHPIPHENSSTEIYVDEGPFTLVPQADFEGCPSSAVVWMQKGRNAIASLSQSVPEFEDAITERSLSLFGPLKLISPRVIWPVTCQIATRFAAQRVALLAEAAHVLPPIGAQGLNMSIADLRVLVDLAGQHSQDLGSLAMLNSYHRIRIHDIRIRSTAIDLLNRLTMSNNTLLHRIRATGLSVVHDWAPVRHGIMRFGLGIG